MSRINWGMVEHYLELVNTMTKNKYKFYKTEQGKQLVSVDKNTGAMHDISRFLSTTEAYEVVYAMYALLTAERTA